MLIASMVFSAALACASNITVTGVDQTRGQNIWFQEDGQTVQGYAGGIVMSLGGASTAVLCVDLFTNININDSFDANFILPQYIDPTNASRGLRAAYLFVSQYAGLTTAAQGAALQLAIWDIVHDGGDGLSAGRVQQSTTVGSATDAAIRNAAIQYIQVSMNYQTTPLQATVFRHVQGPYAKQQLIGAYQPGTGAPIPEPSTVLLLGCGLGLVGWRHAQGRGKSAPTAND